MCSYTHITWNYELRNQYPLTELEGRRFSEHEYITVRGKTDFGEKRSVWPFLTMQTKVRISRAFSHWNSWDSTSFFLKLLQNTLITIDCFSQSLGRCMKLRIMKLKSWLLTNLTFCPPTGRGQKRTKQNTCGDMWNHRKLSALDDHRSENIWIIIYNVCSAYLA